MSALGQKRTGRPRPLSGFSMQRVIAKTPAMKSKSLMNGFLKLTKPQRPTFYFRYLVNEARRPSSSRGNRTPWPDTIRVPTAKTSGPLLDVAHYAFVLFEPPHSTSIHAIRAPIAM
jgi:hypothetical protein